MISNANSACTRHEVNKIIGTVNNITGHSRINKPNSRLRLVGANIGCRINYSSKIDYRVESISYYSFLISLANIHGLFLFLNKIRIPFRIFDPAFVRRIIPLALLANWGAGR
jgi:hypothetical protein